MACPPLEELLAGAAEAHAAGCDACKAILEMAAPRSPSSMCGLAEALIASRIAGPLAPASEEALRRHLATCSGCLLLASELESAGADDGITPGVERQTDLVDFTVVPRENYDRGKEIGQGGMGRIVLARDRRLGRAVAIKELLDARLRPRFEREARLTARLQHPAIVSVHEAGRWPSGEPFYAMKYVAGQPLHMAIAEKPTLVQRLSLLPHFTTVAEAISYAHSERVIHRDLKPHNILIGAFGETVVIDWGLAKNLATADPADRATTPGRGGDGVALTAAGAGTPAYMAPEQACGEEPDEGVDIYALGATLHHLLAGAAPGDAPLPVETPAELSAIVHKALAPDRADRYRTAAELADELKRFQTGQLVAAHRYSLRALAARWLRRHRTGIVAAAALVAVVSSFVAARRAAAPPIACGGAEAEVASAWNPAMRSSIEEKFLASGRPYAADTFTRVATALDGYTARWAGMRKEACESTAVRHEQSEALLDLRMQCLDRRLGGMRALTTLFARAPDGDVLNRAVVAVDKLEGIADCADVEVLAATAPLPVDPSLRAQIAALRASVRAVHALYLVGKYTPALDALRPLIVEADRLAYAPLQLEAVVELYLVQSTFRDFKAMEESIHEQLELAARLKDDRQLADAWISLVGTFEAAGRTDEALGLRGVAEVAVARAGNSGDLRAKLIRQVAKAYDEKGAYGEAEKALRQGIALLEAEPGRDEIALAETVEILGNVLGNGGRYAEARAQLQRAHDLWVSRVGPDHPLVAGTATNIANMLEYEGKYEKALAVNRDVLVVFEGAYGAGGADVAIPLNNLGGEEIWLGRYTEAVDHLRRAIAIHEKNFGATDRLLPLSLVNLGEALAYLGRCDEADRAVERARAIAEKAPGVEHPTYALVLNNLGIVAHLCGRCRDAIGYERRAVASYEKALSGDHPDLVNPLVHLGACEVEVGRPRDAIPDLERALAIHAAKGGDPADEAAAQLALGRARWSLTHGDASALALVARARAGFAALGGAANQRQATEIERWLAERGAR